MACIFSKKEEEAVYSNLPSVIFCDLQFDFKEASADDVAFSKNATVFLVTILRFSGTLLQIPPQNCCSGEDTVR